MRMIGQLRDEAGAKLFGDYLVARGIDNQMERESDGTYVVWIHSEDHLQEAQQELAAFRTNSDDPKFHQAAATAEKERERKRKEQARFQKRVHTRENLWRKSNAGRLTLILIVACVGVFVISGMGQNIAVMNLFFLDLPRVFRGEVWRLISPIFLHLSPLHILFNMVWLYSLGTQIEKLKGPVYFGAAVFLIGLISNLGEYFLGHMWFGGMSGVIYGLVGFIWIKGKLDPFSGFFIDPTSLTIIMVWFFLCWSGFLGGIANIAHTVGLLTGLAWGYLSAQARHR